MRLLSSWVHTSLAPFYFFMSFLTATKCQHSVIMARKENCMGTWSTYNEVTSEFNLLSDTPRADCVKESVENIERFVVLLYDRSSECLRVDAARIDLFTRKGQSIDNIRPSSSALQQHIKRAAYQAGYCWGQYCYCFSRKKMCVARASSS